MNDEKGIPKAAQRRLLATAGILKACGKRRITSEEIARTGGGTPSQVRHDIWLTGYQKGASNGYDASDLAEWIEKRVFFCEDQKNLCIVGLGRLGAALLDGDFFEESGYRLKAGFDSSLNRVEILRSVYPLYPATAMESVLKKENITAAVLTVADKDANLMTERLVRGGIKGIVNMTQTVLNVPDGVKVENISVINALKLLLK